MTIIDDAKKLIELRDKATEGELGAYKDDQLLGSFEHPSWCLDVESKDLFSPTLAKFDIEREHDCKFAAHSANKGKRIAEALLKTIDVLQISRMRCGHPDPAEGCRINIKHITQTLKDIGVE